MQYGVLGPLEVTDDDGTPLSVGGAKPRTLVALLLSERDRTVSVERLVDELWGATPPASAAATLHTYVSRLRRVLGAADLVTDAAGYALRPPPERVDRGRFEAAVERGRGLLRDGDPAAAADALVAANALWRGPALPELADSELAQGEIVRLEESRRVAEEELFEAELAAGRHGTAIPRLESAVAKEPLRERRWGQLLLALYRAGRQADALRRYQDVRRLLAEELGIDPGPELSRLEQAILAQDPSLELPGERARRRAPPRRALPAPVTSFVGRSTEAAEVAAALGANRLVTLVGPGGVGKTRLALELAREHAEDEPEDLVEVVELAGVADADWVAAVVAGALGTEDTRGESAVAAIAATLAERPALIVLDNCEHVIGACAELVDAVLSRAPDLRVLATSREPLGVPGEVVWRLAPMETADAVALFRERAGQAAPVEVAAVGELCARLDCLPLAIELAAARVRGMGIGALLAGLDDRFEALGSLRAGPERQRSLGALVEWSYDLLDPADQRLFALLSVFHGSFEAPAVEAVATALGDAHRLVFRLAELTDKSLLQPEPANRYRMLEMIRQFAADQLERAGLAPVARAAHQQWFAAFAEQAKTALQSSKQAEWLERCERDLDNLRSAIERAAAQPDTVHDALVMATGLQRFWLVRHVGEGLQLLEGVLAAATEESAACALTHARAGGLAERAGDAALGREHQSAAIQMARRVGARAVEALALNELAVIHRDEGDLETGLRLGREALDIAREAGDASVLGSCLGNLGGTYLRRGAHVDARALYEEAVLSLRRAGDLFAASSALTNLAVAAYQAGDLESSRQFLGEAAELHHQLGDVYGLATNLNASAQVAGASGDFDAAERYAVDSLALMRDIGHRHNVSIALGTLADARIGRGVSARDVLDEKLALDRELGFAAGEATALLLLAREMTRLGDLAAAERFAIDAVDRARTSGNEAVLAEVLIEAGATAAARANVTAARAAYEEARAIFAALEQHPEVERCLEALKELDAD